MDDKKEMATVPYFVHQGCLARDERIIKRIAIALVITIFLMFASNAIWLYAWMQYDYVSETTTETTTNATQDCEGVNIIGNGDISYGAESNDNDDPQEGQTTDAEQR